MKTPKNGFRVVWFMFVEAAMSLMIITASIKVNLFFGMLLATLVVLVAIKLLTSFSKTEAGQAIIARNRAAGVNGYVNHNDAPIVLKTAIDSWKLVLTLPFVQLKKAYSAISSHIATKETTTKDIPRKLPYKRYKFTS